MPLIKTDTGKARIFLWVFIFIAFAAAIIPAKWGIANSIALRAEYTEVADIARMLAPDDPQTNFTSAFLREHSPDSPEFENSLAGYEKAASLAPNNYLYWLELGNARARSGEDEAAESALRRALTLAPNYSAVQWALGNTILRRGKSDEAFELFRRAAAGNAKYANSAAVTIWQYLDRDFGRTLAIVESDPALMDPLIGVLAADKRLDEALALWDRLAGSGKSIEPSESGKTLYAAMIEAKRFRNAFGILSGLEPDGGHNADSINNGGFESPVKTQNASLFEWRIADGAAPRIALTDVQKHSGNLSLLIAFGGGDREQFRSISQTVAVTPGAKYVFSFYSRSELKTGAEIKWEIIDAARGTAIAELPVAAANSEWTASAVEFIAPDDSDGVELRLARAKCPVAGCGTSGNIWFDDIKLSRQ